ncbi:hypothetical protein KUTeg_020575 [Tegillarca granosa]|uniref:Uncharacterized protein n=1 Tax=Tegillarca granosa TaxID=220873 RepID=A0ABQ9EEA6_TEGGR|nr:hypothetical protein KUTeg_020575 [Tegillarca granosa]
MEDLSNKVINLTSSVNDRWNELKTGILNIMNDNIPTKLSAKKHSMPWITSQLKKNFIKENYKKNIRNAHWNYVNETLNKSLEDGNNKSFWKYIKAKRNDSIGVAAIKSNGVLYHDSATKAELLNAQFKSVFTVENPNAELPDITGQSYPNMQDLQIKKSRDIRTKKEELFIHNGADEKRIEKARKKCIKRSETIFEKFLQTQGLDCNLKQYENLRYRLCRHILSETGIDVADSDHFNESLEVYRSVLVDLKRKGFGSTDHTRAITAEDMTRLYDVGHVVFTTTTPVGLQQKVWFEIMFYLCRRGRENLRDMTTRETFAVGTDSTGRRYAYQVRSELDKNHRERDKPDESIGEGRMYEILGDDLCPVASFTKYKAKLHPVNQAL